MANKEVDELLKTIVNLNTVEEARLFLRDLLTESELLEFGRRWKAARMLADKKPYSQIVSTTGLSSATVARISSWLKDGMGGYQLMINRERKRA